ncbi:MAG: hypothetical protein PHF67_05585, partial [Candidatus Nanoarchaeia archaeon]|nr:hypothetical protein [Candidatus Nanoarchaeia archaeon]
MTEKLEERFQDALGRWKEHFRNNPFHSFPKPYLDCDAYREIVSMGVSSLPLIRNQLCQEIETNKRYDDELKRLKTKVFGTDQVELFDDNYRKICEDEEYQKYQEGYGSEIMGNPGQFWSYIVHDMVGDDFRIKVAEEGPVKPRGGFVAIDVKEVM